MYVDIHTHHADASSITISSVGVHPWQADDESLLAYVKLHAPVVDAIGEIGLDGVCKVSESVQEQIFGLQLAIAEGLRKPVVIHCVKRFEKVLQMVEQHNITAVILHGFVGSREQMIRAIERGYYLSFGHRTFASPRTADAFCNVPLNRAFAETDDGNYAIEDIYARLAELKGITTEELAQNTLNNYRRLFPYK